MKTVFSVIILTTLLLSVSRIQAQKKIQAEFKVDYVPMSNYIRPIDSLKTDSKSDFKKVEMAIEIPLSMKMDHRDKPRIWSIIGYGGYAKHIEGIKSLNLRFLVDKRHRFKAPTHIEIWSDGLLIKTVNASSYHLLGKTAEASINLDFKGSSNMKLIFFKSVGDRITTALDEVQITN